MAFGESVSERFGSRLTCLFWNVHRQDRHELIGAIAAEKDADVVVLAENQANRDATIDVLRRCVDGAFYEPPSETPRLQVLARRQDLDLREVFGHANGRMSIRALKYQGTEFLFVAAHLSSKVHWSSSDQGTEAQVVASQLRRVEEKRGHNRTILVGDLNMNPFEDGVVAAAGLHAMMTKACVASRTRIVQGQEYPFFYNPMWSFFGDRNEGPPGTFYHHRSGHHVSYGWNIFDQVLFRPDVLPWFQADIEIVTKIGETELTGEDGRPNAEIGSDHFPLVFRLVPKG